MFLCWLLPFVDTFGGTGPLALLLHRRARRSARRSVSVATHT